MTIRNRMLILFSAIIILLCGVLFVFFKSQKKQNELMLRSAVAQQAELVNTAINVKSGQLNELLADYTIWDDLIYHLSSPDQKWAIDNIGTSIESFHLNSIHVYDLKSKLIYNFGDSTETIFTDSVQKQKVLGAIMVSGNFHYFCNSSKGIIEISASTIHPTFDLSHSTPAKGIFILTKCWDSVYLQELSRNTSSRIGLIKKLEQEPYTISKDSLIVFKTLSNDAGQNIAVLAFSKSNKALASFNKINDFVFIFLCLFLTLIIVSFFFVFYQWVRKPLRIISASLSDGETSQLEILEKNKDEFSQVAELIKVFNYQKAELQAENLERRLSENRLLRQSNILQGMAEASNLMLTGENPDICIIKALEIIGKVSEIDRIFVYKNDTDPSTGIRKVKHIYEWISPVIAERINKSECDEFIYIHVDNVWYYPLFERKALKGLTSEFPGEIKLLFERQLIKSLIVVPIIDQEDDTFWGVVGFADCTTEQNWSISEENSLRMLANNIRNALRRYESHEKLKAAMFQAQSADRAKSDFLASMSHEIRTPMNGVFGMTSLLLHTDLSEIQREYVEIIENSGDNLMNIINEILDFSKIESGRMDLENSSFDLRRCVEDVLDLVAPKALDKHLDIIYYIDPEVNQFIFGDGFRLRQIIVNLIGNAIKFTEKGEIYIHIMLKESFDDGIILEFSVKDTGIGIPNDKISSLFSPFMQADASTTRKYGGTGLGLAISSNLVKLMKGKIWVESIAGQGSDFRFTIETRFTTPNADINPIYKVLQSLPGKNILIVDDNPTNRKILDLQCEFWGMKATTVESGEKALEILKTGNKFDVGILDMQMPEMDGIMLAREIRTVHSKKELPLIMLTSIGYNIQTEDMQNLFAHYVNKPIKHSQLADILLKVLYPNASQNPVQLSNETNLGLLAQKFPFEILVAEDNIINQKMIRNVLQLLGYSTDLAANGLEVIEAVKRKRYELIFMDIQMPEMDGYEATRIIVEHMPNERPIIIAMTANALSSDREKCLAVGMDDYITKPLKVEDLQKTFQYWGEKQGALLKA